MKSQSVINFQIISHRHFDFVQVNDDIIDDLSFKNIKQLQDYDEQEKIIFFYHKDHLGSSTQISDRDANIIHHPDKFISKSFYKTLETTNSGLVWILSKNQYSHNFSNYESRLNIEYMPTGEQFSEQRDYWSTPYKFNSKELDAETGLYYYGARYYTPEIGIWLSVDPMADKAPEWSPYVYCFNNPTKLVDPDGRFPWEAKNVRDARKYERNNGGEFHKWKSESTGQTFASVNYNKNGNDGVVEAQSKVFKPEGKSWGQNLKDFLSNVFQGNGSNGGSRGGTMLSTNKESSPQGPAISTNGSIGDNAYTNVDNFPTLNAAKNSGGIIGEISNIANAFTISDKLAGSIKNMSTNDYSNPDEKVRVDYVNKKTGCGGSRTNVPRKDSARVAEVETNRQ